MKTFLAFIFALLISFSIASAVDVNPPLMKSINVVDIRQDSASIIWFTDENSTSVVQVEGLLVNGSDLVTNHNIKLRQLAPGTEYFYNVTSCDVLGNCATAGGKALRFTTLPLYTGTDNNLAESNASRLIRASSSESYLIKFNEQNPFKGSFTLRSGFLFSVNGTDYGLVITKMNEDNIEVTQVPKTNISAILLNTTKEYDFNNDNVTDIEFRLDDIGKRLAVGDQGIRYVEYYANVSIRSFEIVEIKVPEKPRVNFTSDIIPYKIPSGPDKEGNISILSRILPKAGGSIVVGSIIFLVILAAGLLTFWLIKANQ